MKQEFVIDPNGNVMTENILIIDDGEKLILHSSEQYYTATEEGMLDEMYSQIDWDGDLPEPENLGGEVVLAASKLPDESQPEGYRWVQLTRAEVKRREAEDEAARDQRIHDAAFAEEDATLKPITELKIKGYND